MSSTATQSTPTLIQSETVWQRFAVPCDYPVVFTNTLFEADNCCLPDTLDLVAPGHKHRLYIVIDDGITRQDPTFIKAIDTYVAAHADRLELVCAPVVVPGGERIKTELATMTALQSDVAARRLDRHAWIVAIGGGAVLDAVGLVAATSHRGIRHVRIPSTVLAQNDAGIGVKNGVNLFGQKNWLGTFSPPQAVINDQALLATLSPRDAIAGMSEAVKVALIRDADFFQWLEDKAESLAALDADAMQYLIRRCAELHLVQIANGGDPFEKGTARPLDFGHWSAHRLEYLSHHLLSHGEAVAIGIAIDTRYSVLTGLLDEGLDERVCKLLETLGFKLWHDSLAIPGADGEPAVLDGLAQFREHLGGQLTITLLEAPGKSVDVHDMDKGQLKATIDWLKTRARSSSLPLKSVAPDSVAGKVAANESQVAMQASSASEHVQALCRFLDSLLGHRLTDTQNAWLGQTLSNLDDNNTEKNLHLALGLAPRRLGRADLSLSDTETSEALALRDGWQAKGWSVDEAARVRLLLAYQRLNPATFSDTFVDLCRYADLGETICYYRATALLPFDDTMSFQIGEGLRTHVRAVFEAIAHDNPCPREHFDDNRWNHVVLKALFIDSTLWPIVGLDQRANPELARILHDYSRERRAAGRIMSPEIWRCMARFAEGDMLADVLDVLNGGTRIEQLAIAKSLSLASQGEALAAFQELEASDPELVAAAQTTDWQTLAVSRHSDQSFGDIQHDQHNA